MAVAVLLALEAIFYVINAKGSKSRLKRGGFSRTTGEDAFRETIRSDDFYVLFFPEATFYGRDMQGHLSAAGVRMRDYRNRTDGAINTRFRGDRHPAAVAHEALTLR